MVQASDLEAEAYKQISVGWPYTIKQKQLAARNFLLARHIFQVNYF